MSVLAMSAEMVAATVATIEAKGVSKRFGKTVALDGLDLVAEPGQIVAVLGPNGAGKTTFVRAVSTLPSPTAAPFTWRATTSSGNLRRCGG